MPRTPSFIARSLLALSLAGLVSTGCDEPQSAQPAADSAQPPAPSSSGVASATAPSTASAVAAVTASASSAPADAPPGPSALGDKGLVIDEALAPKGILRAGEADKIMKPSDPPKVVLISSGADPKAALSYDLSPKSKQRSSMKMDMTMNMTMAGAPPSMPGGVKLPQIEMAIDMTTGDTKEANGEIPLTVLVSDVKLNAASEQEKQVAKMMGAQLAAMKGLKIKSIVDPKGRARDVVVEVPKDTPAEAQQMVEQMKQSMEQMVAPLPDGDVGVGAQWQVISRVATGADILQWTTYTLVKRDGSKIELDGDVHQVAANAALSGAGLPPGVTADIQSFRSSGKGKTMLDLTTLAPILGTGDVTSSLSVAAGSKAMQVDTSVKITFAGKK